MRLYFVFCNIIPFWRINYGQNKRCKILGIFSHGRLCQQDDSQLAWPQLSNVCFYYNTSILICQHVCLSVRRFITHLKLLIVSFYYNTPSILICLLDASLHTLCLILSQHIYDDLCILTNLSVSQFIHCILSIREREALKEQGGGGQRGVSQKLFLGSIQK